MRAMLTKLTTVSWALSLGFSSPGLGGTISRKEEFWQALRGSEKGCSAGILKVVLGECLAICISQKSGLIYKEMGAGN